MYLANAKIGVINFGNLMTFLRGVHKFMALKM